MYTREGDEIRGVKCINTYEGIYIKYEVVVSGRCMLWPNTHPLFLQFFKTID